MTRVSDDLFDALANRYCRRVLVTLLAEGAKEETAIPEAIQRGETSLDSLNAEMHHVHLPKLEKLGFIEWDREAQLVKRGPKFDEIQQYLQVIYEERDKLPNSWE